MKTYARIRGSSKLLLIRVRAGEAVDIDKTNVPSKQAESVKARNVNFHMLLSGDVILL